MSTVTLTIKNALAEIARVTALVEQLVSAQGLAADAVWPVSVAIDEVLSNIIRYGYGDAREHAIEVRLSVDLGGVTIAIEDDGVPFDPLSAPAPDIEQRVAAGDVGGLGIHIVRRLMSDVAYARIAGRNRFIMHSSFSAGCDPCRIELGAPSDNGIKVLAIEGRLDSITAGDLEASLATVALDAPQRLLIDCEQLRYASSAGLRALYRILTRVEACGGKAVLCDLSAPVRELVAITGFNTLFRIADARADAIEALR